MKKQTLVGLVIISLLLIICFVIYLKITTSVSKEFEASETKQYALSLAKTNKTLQNFIGSEIYEDTLRSSPKKKGQIKLSLDFDGFDLGHDAVDMEIPIRGDLGKAIMSLKATKVDGIWTYKTISVNVIAYDTLINLKPNKNN